MWENLRHEAFKQFFDKMFWIILETSNILDWSDSGSFFRRRSSLTMYVLYVQMKTLDLMTKYEFYISNTYEEVTSYGRVPKWWWVSRLSM